MTQTNRDELFVELVEALRKAQSALGYADTMLGVLGGRRSVVVGDAFEEVGALLSKIEPETND